MGLYCDVVGQLPKQFRNSLVGAGAGTNGVRPPGILTLLTKTKFALVGEIGIDVVAAALFHGLRDVSKIKGSWAAPN